MSIFGYVNLLVIEETNLVYSSLMSQRFFFWEYNNCIWKAV
jgi:hypothetical protein